MSTTPNRASTWTNPDGLVVGYGTHKPMYEGTVAKNYGGMAGSKVAAVTFDYNDLNSATYAINVPVPAGTRVLDVRVVIDQTFAGAGNTFTVGDGTTADGFITAAAGVVASMIAGAVIGVNGVYVFGTTDTTATELKVYATADTVDLASADVDWTAGKGTLFVTYL